MVVRPLVRTVYRSRWRRVFRWFAIVLPLALLGCGPSEQAPGVAQGVAASPDEAGVAAGHPFPRRVPAPSLAGGRDWLNTTRPLTLAACRGKFVLIDFWTFCCINCMHVLPELKQLEEAYPHELVVIGVHSAKFEQEQDTENIREAVLRYEIAHPVVNDAEMTIGKRYGARSWPTLVLIDPNGEVVWVGRGEKTFEELRALVERGLPYYRAEGLIDTSPLAFIQRLEPPNTPLRFPGKVLADESGGRAGPA